MKKTIILCINIIAILILTGCWEKKDVDQLTLGLALGIDKKGNGIEVTTQVMNPYVIGQQPLNQAAVVAISVEAETVLEAMRKMTVTVTGKLFVSHFQVLLFGEELAREGIEPYLKFFMSDPETQHKYTIVIVKGDTANNVLKVQTMLNLIPVISIYQKVSIAEKVYGISEETLGIQAYSEITSEGIDTAIPTVKIKGDAKEGEKNENTQTTSPKAVINVAGMSVFRGDKLVGYLSEKESLGYNHLMNNVKSFAVPTNIDENTKFSFEGIDKPKIKRKVIIEGNKPKIVIEYKMTGRIGEVLKGEVSYSKEFREKAETAISEEVKGWMQQAVDKAIKEYKSDIFGFGQAIHRKDYKLWKEIKDKYLEDLNVEINVKTILRDILQ